MQREGPAAPAGVDPYRVSFVTDRRIVRRSVAPESNVSPSGL